MLVKVLLQVLYDKIQHKGWDQEAIHHKAKPSAVFAMKLHLEYFILSDSTNIRTVPLLISWICIGGLRGRLFAHVADSVISLS